MPGVVVHPRFWLVAIKPNPNVWHDPADGAATLHLIKWAMLAQHWGHWLVTNHRQEMLYAHLISEHT